jgi:hypothetical protein
LLLGANNSYHIGKTKDVFRPGQVEKLFGVRTFTGTVGEEKFFLPLGKYAKDVNAISTEANGNRKE